MTKSSPVKPGYYMTKPSPVKPGYYISWRRYLVTKTLKFSQRK